MRIDRGARGHRPARIASAAAEPPPRWSVRGVPAGRRPWRIAWTRCAEIDQLRANGPGPRRAASMCSTPCTCAIAGCCQRDRRALERQTELAFSARGIGGQRRDILEPVLAHAGRDAHIRQDLAGIDRHQRWPVVQVHAWHHAQACPGSPAFRPSRRRSMPAASRRTPAGTRRRCRYRSADCQRSPPSPVSARAATVRAGGRSAAAHFSQRTLRRDETTGRATRTIACPGRTTRTPDLRQQTFHQSREVVGHLSFRSTSHCANGLRDAALARRALSVSAAVTSN